jgi:hypothetical protein
MIRLLIPRFFLRFLARREAYRRRIAELLQVSTPVAADDWQTIRNKGDEPQNQHNWIRPRTFNERWGPQSQAEDQRLPNEKRLQEAIEKSFRGRK